MAPAPAPAYKRGMTSRPDIHNPVRGILLVLVAGILFTAGSAMIKSLSPGITVTQMVFFRGVPGLIPILIVLHYQGGLRALRTDRPLAHLFRFTIGLFSVYVGFSALSQILLADFVAINFAGPIFATALSVPLLGEHVGWRRWSAVVAGFIGVLLIVQPFGQGVPNGALLAVASAFGYGLIIIAMRTLGRTEKAVVTTFYFTFGTAIVSSIALPFDWHPPTTLDWVLLTSMGLMGAIAQMLVSQAYRHGAPAVIAPFDYVSMIWALLFGYVLFGTLPNALSFAGAGLVILAGIYIVYRETVRGVAKPRIKTGPS